MTAQLTVWVAYNSDNDCFASHEGAQEAMDGLVESFGHLEGARVVTLKLTVPTAKPLAFDATVGDVKGPVTVTLA